MKKLKPREIFLLVVLIVSGSIVGYMNFGRGGFGGSSATAAEDDIKIGNAPVVRLARLGSDSADYDPKGRNLFNYGAPPHVNRPVPKAAPPVVIDRKPPVVRPPVNNIPRNVTPPRPRPPVPTFKYVGYFGPKYDKIAAFDDGEQMLLARVGETVQDDFVLMDFEYQAVRLGFTDQRFDGQDTELSLAIPGGSRATSGAAKTQDGARRGRRRR